MLEKSPVSSAELLQKLDGLMDRVDGILDRLHGTPEQEEGIFGESAAFRWVRREVHGRIEPIRHPDLVDLKDLIGLDRELKLLSRNTEQFVRGLPANNVLIWGERGTGKSSTVKGFLDKFADQGLRMIEVQKGDLRDLPAIVDLIWDRPERFILFCDDLSFDEGETDYRELKALLEGSLSARPKNVLIYATSNRRHLMPDRFRDNTPRLNPDDDEIHPQEGVEERVSLSDRFGLSLGFYRIDQDTFLRIVDHWVSKRNLSIDPKALRSEALQWLQRTSGRSGRVARQFVDDLTGRLQLGNGGTG